MFPRPRRVQNFDWIRSPQQEVSVQKVDFGDDFLERRETDFDFDCLGEGKKE